MKNLFIADNHTRKTIVIDPETTTVAEAFADNNMDPNVGLPFLNGVAVPASALDKTIKELAGDAEEYRLTKTVKSDGNF